jgi:hypothetical protein
MLNLMFAWHADCVSHEDTGKNVQWLPLQVAEEGISCDHAKYLRIKKQALKKKFDRVWQSEGCPYDDPVVFLPSI